jgi:hypothetical protein
VYQNTSSIRKHLFHTKPLLVYKNLSFSNKHGVHMCNTQECRIENGHENARLKTGMRMLDWKLENVGFTAMMWCTHVWHTSVYRITHVYGIYILYDTLRIKLCHTLHIKYIVCDRLCMEYILCDIHCA